jgi:hypothetical protein
MIFVLRLKARSPIPLISLLAGWQGIRRMNLLL